MMVAIEISDQGQIIARLESRKRVRRKILGDYRAMRAAKKTHPDQGEALTDPERHSVLPEAGAQ